MNNKKRTEIESADSSIIESNIDGISLKIGLQLLFTAMGIDTYSDMLELIPLIQGDTATTISVAQMIDKYLEVTANVTFPQRIEGIVLQNVLQWLNSENLDIRCIAARILLTLARNPENEIIVNRRLLSLIDTECVYIKNMPTEKLSVVRLCERLFAISLILPLWASNPWMAWSMPSVWSLASCVPTAGPARNNPIRTTPD